MFVILSTLFGCTYAGHVSRYMSETKAKWPASFLCLIIPHLTTSMGGSTRTPDVLEVSLIFYGNITSGTFFGDAIAYLVAVLR